MRAIDADALQIAIVEEGQANKRKKYNIGDIWELTGAEIREVINSQPTIQPEPHWISCKKELPKLDSRCVLLYSNYNISGGYYRGNRTFDVDYGDEDVNTMVIAWMPKPDSYQPKNEVTE